MKTIVIVEDEFRIREGLAALINKVEMGCRVIGEAENGYEGLKMIQDLEPDIVITDIQMPKSTGLEMMETVRNMGIACTFVVLSGYANFEYAQQAIRLGVKDYLLKPITISAVKDLLRKLTKEEEAPKTSNTEQQFSPMVAEMVHLIRTDYAKHLGLDVFADKFKMTSQYLSNLFAKETGMTFSNYVKKVRTDRAQELILTTDMKIYEIACMVGYPDQKYFSKVFKECTGVSAKQFAVQHQKNGE